MTVQVNDLDKEIMQHLANGCSQGVAAYRVGYSHDYIKDRLKWLRRDLQAINTTNLIAIAIRKGIIV